MNENRKIKKVDIIEKFSPRHPSIAGRSVKLMADLLDSNGLVVHTFSIDAIYKGQIAENIRLPYQVTELKAVYNGNNKICRLLVSLLDGFRLIFCACRNSDADVRIVLTNPSLINFWAAVFKHFSRSRWIFWTMDLYPDAFGSAGLVKPQNPLFRMIHHWVYRTAPDYMISLGERQYAYLKNKYKTEIPHTILPAGINPMKQIKQESGWKERYENRIVMCYAGNLGEAHDAIFLLQLIERLDPERFVMILSLYGSKTNWLLERVKSKAGVIVVDHVELELVDINVASLLPCWDHVCVPSKVVSAICAGTPVLYNASEYSEGYCMFPDAIWLIRGANDYSQPIIDFYRSLTREMIDKKKQAAIKYAQQLVMVQENAFQEIIQYCKNA